ncbi:unnamed protein product [Adineta ricciae]|uniref:Uncharacterized protein n=1 Tax=Adineta ricciae TaxID=249248 RepID=A0A815DAE9_ADIRI|nr:unnamed protein product [Adineta ricciae]
MKLAILSLTIVLFLCGTIENAPVIHPIHVHTIPLRPITPPRSSIKPVTPFHTSRRPHVITTADHHYVPYQTKGSYGWTIAARVFACIVLGFSAVKLLSLFCSSKKSQTTNKSTGIKNQLYVATIEGKREESPPSYAQIHKV